ERGQPGGRVDDRLHLQPRHGHGVGDLGDAGVGLEMLLEPGQGELHGLGSPTTWMKLSMNSGLPVKPTAKNEQWLKRQSWNAMAPMTFSGATGRSRRLRMSPPV